MMIKNIFHKVFISFGSNEGNRLKNILNALREIEIQLGRIETVSCLYKSKSWGFVSRDFYNGCLILNTKYSLKTVLNKLQGIEISLGRVRTNCKDYDDRKIDLDILFFDRLIKTSKKIIVPHPRINIRNFVLIPLCDLNPNYTHPINNKSIFKILSQSKDNSEVKKIKENNFYVPFWNKNSFISIEGNIGVGKTTLGKVFKSHFGIDLLNENYKQNPYLKNFYSSPSFFSLKLENFFFHERIKQIKSQFKNNKNKKTISDYWIGKSLVFSKVNLSKVSFEEFRLNYKKEVQNIKMPDIIIFLKQETTQLKKQIIDRGRTYEKGISNKYLKSISKEYKNIFNKKHNFLLLEVKPKEVKALLTKKGQQKLFRKLFSYST
jgi:deoxyguanosine kinase|tara:strand:- start:566 stop:1696 length:1131 start_codon:yes stop_codon:yes gene_type:complete